MIFGYWWCNSFWLNCQLTLYPWRLSNGRSAAIVLFHQAFLLKEKSEGLYEFKLLWTIISFFSFFHFLFYLIVWKFDFSHAWSSQTLLFPVFYNGMHYWKMKRKKIEQPWTSGIFFKLCNVAVDSMWPHFIWWIA